MLTLYSAITPKPKTSFRKMMGSAVVDDLLKHYATIVDDQVEFQSLNLVKYPVSFFQ